MRCFASAPTGQATKSVRRISPYILASRRYSGVLGRGAVTDLLAALASAMRSREIRWYLFGAQAAMVWGRPRFSADVDITAAIDPSGIDAFIQSMERSGFELRFRDPQFVARTRVLPFFHRGSGLPVDVVIAGPGLEEEFLERAVSVDLEGVAVPIISPEDLIVTKILAGRPKDLEDVHGVLLERRSSLDLARIRKTLQLLEQALGQSDLMRAFESELRRLPAC